VARTVSDQLWTTLRELDANCVFGLPGSQTIEAFQALRRSGLRTVVPTHEMAAAFMANGYARASGRPGILTTIPGPGFTYALTGLAEAWLDSVPVVYIVPAARERPGGEFALQSIDQRAMAGAIVKRILRVEEASALAAAIVDGYRLAVAGEPGPVMVELPEELFAAESAGASTIPPSSRSKPPAAAVDETIALINDAPRVLLLLGAGALGGADAARTLAALTRAAIATTTTARGVVSEEDNCVIVRDPGMQDAAILNDLAGRADLILAIGCKFSHNGAAGFRMTLPEGKLVTVNAAGPSRNYPARLHLTADSAAVLETLAARIPARSATAPGWDVAELASWRAAALEFAQAARVEPRFEGTGMPVSAVIGALRNALPDDAIVVTDSGLHQMSMRRYYEVRSPLGLIVPTNFQSMGFALPAAIGAAIAAPGRRVVAVIGDGGMMMSGLELLTAVREKIALTVLVFNDGAYSLIRNAQLADHGASHGTELFSPGLEALAASVGAEYVRSAGDDIAQCLGAAPSGDSSVRLIELPLEDSPGLTRVRLRGNLRALKRRLIGRRHRR
jgi:acetolactate synthase-1/2/3 large subunit